MKKILLILVLAGVLSLASCNAPTITIADEEGWEVFQLGWSLYENQFLVQSHDGYVCNDIFYNEGIFTIDEETPEYIIENVLNHEINVRITHDCKEKWVKLPALMQLTLKEEEE